MLTPRSRESSRCPEDGAEQGRCHDAVHRVLRHGLDGGAGDLARREAGGIAADESREQPPSAADLPAVECCPDVAGGRPQPPAGDARVGSRRRATRQPLERPAGRHRRPDPAGGIGEPGGATIVPQAPLEQGHGVAEDGHRVRSQWFVADDGVEGEGERRAGRPEGAARREEPHHLAEARTRARVSPRMPAAPSTSPV